MRYSACMWQRFSNGLFLALVGVAGLLSGCAGAGRANDHMVWAEVALERGQAAVASRHYRAAATLSADAALAERAARVAFEQSQYRDLVAIATRWLSRDPKSESARRFLAVALLELDDRVAAKAQIRLLIQSAYPSPAEAFDGLARSLAELHNEAGVASVMRALAADYATVPAAQFAAASLSLQAGDLSEAQAAAQRALRLRPVWVEARSLLARAQVALGQCAEGLPSSALLAAEGGDRDRLVYAWLLVRCDHPAEARPYLSDLARSRSFRADALEALGGLDLDARRFDDAIARYNDLLALGRNSEAATYGLAVVADRRGDSDRAISLYRRVLTGSRAVPAQLRAYRLALEQGHAAIAARVLDIFVLNSPDDRVAVTAGRADILADRGQAALALALLSRVMPQYPDRAELGFARATVLEKDGQVSAAISQLRAMLAQRPSDAAAQNALGFTLADHHLHLDEAERLIRSALHERPDSGAMKDSLGWVLYQRGRFSEALRSLTEAYALDADPEIALHLGWVHWALGDQAEALRTWRDALHQSPNEKRLRAVVEQHSESL
jgi:tetratricopeptide (TPR) repeat protein